MMRRGVRKRCWMDKEEEEEEEEEVIQWVGVKRNVED